MNTRSTLRAFWVLVAAVWVVGLVGCKPEQQSSGPISPVPTESAFTSPLVPPTPNPTEAAICARYPTPPYPIKLTPCPYYLTPPAQPIFTPKPRPTPVTPSLVLAPQAQTDAGGTFTPIYVSKNYQGQGELCDLRPSPDGQKIALYMCNTEGMSLVIIMSAKDGKAIGESKSGWFRGWFPDSKQVLLMSDWLEIRDIDTGKSRRITPPGETVTDAAVSPDGQSIAYTTIQGNKLKIIAASGDLLKEILTPALKPGARPEGITWSHDGRFVAYIWDQVVGQFNSYGPLWVVDVQTGKQWQLSPEKVFDGFPAWSPTDSQVLVVRRENRYDESAHFNLNALVSNLWIVDVNTSTWRQLTNFEDKGAWSPIWTPDASSVMFMSNANGQPDVWIINAEGEGLYQLRAGSDMMPRAISLEEVIP